MLKETCILKPLTPLLVLKRFQEHMLTPLEKEYGLSRIELDILHFLMENPSFNTATAIIESNHFSKSHVSGALKHLEALGHVRKFTDARNRKITYLSLNDEAFAIAERVKSCKLQGWATLAKGIPAEDLKTTMRTLEKLVHRAYEMEKKENPL